MKKLMKKEKDIEKIARGKRSRVPTVLQMEAVECGAASLAMIMAYYGAHVSLEELRVQCGVSRDGSKASNILKAARTYGLEGKGYKKEAADLRSMTMPVIIHWNFNHFLVLEGIKGDKVYLNDPAAGKRVVSYDELDQSFTGIVLCFKPGENFHRTARTHSSLKVLSSLCHRNVGSLFFLGITGLLLVAPGLIIPMLSQFFVDTILAQQQSGWFFMLVTAFALVLLMKLALSLTERLLIVRLKTKIAAELSGSFLWKLLHLPMTFFAQRYTGDIASRIESNMNIANSLSSKLMSAVVDVCTALLYLILLFRLNSFLTFICIAITLINVIVVTSVQDKLKMGSQRMLQDAGKLDGVSINGLQMIETLKAGGTEDSFFSKWAGYQAKYVNSYQSVSTVSGLLSILPDVLSRLTEVIILIMCARNVMAGAMTFGMFIAYQQLMSGFLAPVVRTVGFSADFQALDTDIRRTDDVMNYKDSAASSVSEDPLAEGENAKNLIEAGKLQGAVKLENISFGYSILEPPLIEDFSLDLQPGMRVALVGGSGCGKSTIAKIVSGLNQPWSGTLYFDDMPDSSIPREIRAASVAMVDQDISVFSGTVKDNITMWCSYISEAETIRAAKDACIHDDIMRRPGGYYSIIEEGGQNFSGGQLQRLEIARALVTNPRVLVMDEATSALDARTERIISENIRRRGCTMIIIAHRLSTVRDCDLILVLDHGQVIQRGNHEQLSKDKDGLYATLIQAQ